MDFLSPYATRIRCSCLAPRRHPAALPSTSAVRRVTLAALRRPAGRLRPIFSRRSLRQRPPFFDLALDGVTNRERKSIPALHTRVNNRHPVLILRIDRFSCWWWMNYMRIYLFYVFQMICTKSSYPSYWTLKLNKNCKTYQFGQSS